jgi:uncharacterized protein YebE (UPF0316 family)
MLEFVLLFIALNIANVVIQTVKSIATIKCGKTVAAVINAVAYGLYTYVVFFTASDGMDLHIKALITAVANLVGVWVVKYVEEKKAKEKLWKIELAVPEYRANNAEQCIIQYEIPYNSMRVGSWVMFNCYCYTKKQSAEMADIAKRMNGKISAYESKAIF